MAANGRFDLSLSKSDGPTHATGHRVPQAIAPLEKSGSSREGSDRIFSSPHGTSKSCTITSQGEMTYLLHSLASDLKGVAPDPKLNRPGEMKRAMSSIFGASTENSSSSTFETKQFPSSSLEGIKRLKNNLQESSTKARDRAKTFNAACLMIDKFWHLKRKRSRIGYPSNVRTTGLYQGANIPKTGLQSYASGSGLEIGSQREEKPKIGVPSRRIRTSLLEMDVQSNGTARMPGPLERDKDILKSINGSATQLVENDGTFSSVADGWERSKLKKKRSVIKSDASTSSGLSRLQGEREVKRGMQHKLGIDARSRINHAHNFRPVSDSSTTMVGNSDASPQQHAPSMRSRNEVNNGSLQNDKRDVRFCPDTENASLKVITKSNCREDRCAASPSLLKFGSFRTRNNAGLLPKASGSIHRAVGNHEDMELPQATEKLNALGVSNRKRAASVRSSSPPVGQWAIQRPKKFSRSSRRSSLSPLVPSHDELVVSEATDEASIHHDSLGEVRHASLSASQQGKLRGDNLASASLSESEESGVQENKVKCKLNKSTEMEDKSGHAVQKSANLIMVSRKSRMTVEEDNGDGDRRQGRIGRGFAPTRSGLSAKNEKVGEAVTAKQQRSVRHGSERFESKPDRPHIKKLSERKAYTRPKQSINILSMESSEEAADDQEELVAAATAALDTGRACSGPLWKQLEPVFRLVSSEDVDFLLEQIQLTNESAARAHADGDDSQNLKVDHEHAVISSGPVVTNAWKCTALSNGISPYECERERGFTKETVHADPLLYSGISICQALLSAIIGEEDIENICNTLDHGDGYSYDDCYATQFEVEKSLKSNVVNLQLLDDSQAARRTSDCYKDINWRFCDEISTERSGTNGIMDTYNRPISSLQQAPRQLVPKQSTPFSSACTEFQYNQMSINDRLILELSEIGLYPEVEHVPDLTYGEDEDITAEIHMLEKKLNEQASNRKGLLLKLEKAVMDAKELQQRRLEGLAMDRLVQMAYDRYMLCWGPGASGTKNVSKVAKHATMAFVKRTLSRLQKLEETGISCFSQPIFRDIFSASSRSSNSPSMDIPANDHSTFMSSQIARKVDTHAKCSIAAQEHPFSVVDDHWSNRVKKKEVFLDDVAGSTVPSSRTPGVGNSLISGAKGKRSERDRDGKGHGRDSTFKNGPTKIGRPATSTSAKGERKNKSKPKIKTTQLSASVNDLHGKNSLLIPKSSRVGGKDVEKKDNPSSLPDSRTKKSSNDGDAVDLSNLQLPDIDVGDFSGQGQDIASWLSFEDEGLQDHGDCMGLEIPMDDLSDVHMMI